MKRYLNSIGNGGGNVVLRFDILTLVLLKICLFRCDDCWWVGIFLHFKGIKQSWTEEYECLTLKMKAL